jgi:hypothetical protein
MSTHINILDETEKFVWKNLFVLQLTLFFGYKVVKFYTILFNVSNVKGYSHFQVQCFTSWKLIFLILFYSLLLNIDTLFGFLFNSRHDVEWNFAQKAFNSNFFLSLLVMSLFRNFIFKSFSLHFPVRFPM